MTLNLNQELIKLLDDEGLGRIGLLRKLKGTSPVSIGGEYDPNDPRFWEGRSYLDYEVKYYWTPIMMAEIKTALGVAELNDEVVYLAARKDVPAPTPTDVFVPLKHNEDGTLKLSAQGTYLIDEAVGFICFSAVLRYWEDTNSQMTFYVCSSTRSRTGWFGSA